MIKRMVVVAVIAAACAPEPAPTTTAPTTTTTSGITTSPTSAPPVGGCPSGEPLLESGRLTRIDQPSTDSERIGFIGWTTTDGCEQFAIEAVTAEGAPATTPPSVNAELDRRVGILRVSLGLAATTVTDQLVETNLVDRLYVVRDTEGRLFVDFHLKRPVLARVAVASAPARVSVDLEPGGEPYEGGPSVAARVVVTSPVAGPVELPITVEGYARTFEATVVARVRQGGSQVLETAITATDWTETWGSFRMQVDPPVTGSFELFVGESPPSGGPEEGVVIPLESD